MSKPVWMETWGVEFDENGGYDSMTSASILSVEGGSAFGGLDHGGPTCSYIRDPRQDQRARIAAAAPALVRALLAVEWTLYGNECQQCSRHRASGHRPDDAQGLYGEPSPRCVVDAALAAAGLPDQASRDEARRMIAEAKTHG